MESSPVRFAKHGKKNVEAKETNSATAVSSGQSTSTHSGTPEPAKTVETEQTEAAVRDAPVVSTVQSASAAREKTKFTDFDRSATTFAEVVGKQTYLDKSLFLKTIFDDDNKYHLITAPRRFGKSTLLNMVKHFVEVEVDNDGKELVDKANPKLFGIELCGGGHLKIRDAKDKDGKSILEEHMGKYPVVYVDFKCSRPIRCYENAIAACRKAVRKAFLHHRYLEKSSELHTDEQKICRMWIEDVEGTLAEECVATGLYNLAEYLQKHHNKGVYLLVDEYDSIIMNALFEVDGNTLRQITKFCNGVLSEAMKTSDETMPVKGGKPERFVARAIVTGISHIAGVGISDLNNVKSDPFLRRVAFLNYYGLTKSEVEDLLLRLKDTNKIEMNQLAQQYNGYANHAGIQIFPLWSVLLCLDEQESDGRYYDGTGTIEKLAAAFQTPSIRFKTLKLLSGKTVSTLFQEKFTTEDLVELRNHFMETDLTKRGRLMDGIFFSFLFEQGYLTYGEQEGKSKRDGFELANLKIPNEELRDTFRQKLAAHYIKFCNLSDDRRDACRGSLVDLMKVAKTKPISVEFTSAVRKFQLHMQDLVENALSDGSCLKLNEAAFHSAVCMVIIQSDFQFTTEYITSVTGKRLDLAVFREDCGVVLEFKHNSAGSGNTAAAGLQQIKDNGYVGMFDETKIFERKPSTIIIMGLSVTDAKDLAIACEIIDIDMMTVACPDKQAAGISDPKKKASAVGIRKSERLNKV